MHLHLNKISPISFFGAAILLMCMFADAQSATVNIDSVDPPFMVVGQPTTLTLKGRGFNRQTFPFLNFYFEGTYKGNYGNPISFVSETEVKWRLPGTGVSNPNWTATISVSNGIEKSNEIPITLLPSPPTPQFIVNTIAGGGVLNGIPALSMSFAQFGINTGPQYSVTFGGTFDMALGSSGDIFVGGYAAVYKINSRGIVDTIAGIGVPGYSGDGGKALDARMNSIQGVAIDDSQNIYFSDTFNNRIRRVDAKSGMVATLAGDGNFELPRVGISKYLATSLSLINPAKLFLDKRNNLFVSEAFRISRVDLTTGKITKVAGSDDLSQTDPGDNGPALKARILPGQLAVDSGGNVFILDGYGLRRIDANTGIIAKAWDATLGSPTGIAIDSSDNLYVCYGNPTGSTIAIRKTSLSVNGGSSTIVQFPRPTTGGPVRIVVGNSGDFYFWNALQDPIFRLTSGSSTPTRFAGGMAAGDGGLATSGQLSAPQYIATDPKGNIFVSDRVHKRVRQIAAETGVIASIVGTGVTGSDGDGGPASRATLAGPRGLATDAIGDLYIADGLRVRKVSMSTGLITTVAGSGTGGLDGDGGPATQAGIQAQDIAIDKTGNIFIEADPFFFSSDRFEEVPISSGSRNTMRKIDAKTGVINTVDWFDLATLRSIDSSGAVYRRFGAGVTQTSGGSVPIALQLIGQSGGYDGDGSLAMLSRFGCVGTVVVDSRDRIHVADWCNNRIRTLARSSAPSPIVNSATASFGPIVPGEIVSIYLKGIGPSVPIQGELDEKGLLPLTL